MRDDMQRSPYEMPGLAVFLNHPVITFSAFKNLNEILFTSPWHTMGNVVNNISTSTDGTKLIVQISTSIIT